jgi:hypothetical protein
MFDFQIIKTQYFTRILLIWLVYLTFLAFISALPHMPIHFLSWLNFPLFQLLFLLSIATCLIFMLMTWTLRCIALHSEKHQLREHFIFDKRFIPSIAAVDRHADGEAILLVADKVLGNKALRFHVIAGAMYLLIAISAKSLLITIKLTVLVIWIGSVYYSLIYIQNRRSQKGQLLNFFIK